MSAIAKPSALAQPTPFSALHLPDGAPSSPAGPAEPETPVRLAPMQGGGRVRQSLRFVFNPLAAGLRARREFGDVWRAGFLTRNDPFTVTCHPDHVKSLFTAKPQDAHSLTGESPLRPILGPNSVLTAVGDRHMRQRKLLLPAFHGDAVARYVQMIEEVTAREIDSWQPGKPFALAPRMQAVTLDVIMGGVFGIGTRPARGTVEFSMRQTIRRLLGASTNPLYGLIELRNAGVMEPKGILKLLLGFVDRQLFAVIRERRAQGMSEERHDVLSLLLAAHDEEGRPLTDQELRDELLTLVLAGHETTANSLAWTFERLLRAPEQYERLRDAVRSGNGSGEDVVEATIHEGMRVRPVIPMIVRMVNRPWRLGDYVLPARTPVAMNIVALHHREDVYPDPFQFRLERFLETKPGTYTWIPFGGGIRRCLGASLAMAEQRVVLREIARRVDLGLPRSDGPERPQQRNVTMIPRRGGRVVVQRRLR